MRSNTLKRSKHRFSMPDRTLPGSISLKQLSGYWYKLGNPVMAGLYAREIAEKENSGLSWSIAGTTFASGLQQELDEKQKLFVRDQALEAFENAISLEPECGRPQDQSGACATLNCLKRDNR